MNTDSILAEAENIINGSRNADYGDVVANFKRISEIAETTFGISINPVEVCQVLLAVKLAREAYLHKRDNLVDLCGYAEILNRLHESEQQ